MDNESIPVHRSGMCALGLAQDPESPITTQKDKSQRVSDAFALDRESGSDPLSVMRD